MASNYENADELDANPLGTVTPRERCFTRPVANQVVEKDATEYNMNHPKRGKCIIFVYSKFESSMLHPRKSALLDSLKTRKAFEKLGFEVETHQDAKLKDLRSVLKRVRNEDHSDCDCLAVVFMSHGSFEEDTKEQWLWAYDDKFHAEELFHNFVGNNCLSLAGKPKLFFVQACRGERADVGVEMFRRMGIHAEALFPAPAEVPYVYTIPSYADTLIMWASYPGFFAFKTFNNGIQGSVFIHFLSQVFEEDGLSENLASVLLKVTRKVAVEFESYMNDEKLNFNKQVPYTESSLLRHIFFKSKNS